MRKKLNSFLYQSRMFFRDYENEIIRDNWKTVRQMTLLYMGFQILYFFCVCLPAGVFWQTAATLTAIGAQAVFSALLFTHREPPKTLRAEYIWLLVFGAMIVAYAAAVGVFIFRENNAWLFPIELIMLTQFYTMPPVEKFTELFLYSAAFIVGCFVTKELHVATVDLLSVLTAFCIAMVSYFTLMNFKLESAENRRQLKKMCSVDSMTGLLNKNTFEFYYDEFLKKERAEQYALAILDLDSFKKINDAHGHLTGDEVLQVLTMLLNEYFGDPETAQAGRFGGDEFVILLKHVNDEEDLERTLRRFLADLKMREERAVGFPATASIGAAIMKKADVPFSNAFLAADRMLYSVKGNGGDSAAVTADTRNAYREPMVLLISFSSEDKLIFRQALEHRYHLLTAEGIPSAIGALERYGSTISAVFLSFSARSWMIGSLKPELMKTKTMHHFPVIVVTDREDAETQWENVADTVLEKPVTPTDIAKIVLKYAKRK